MEEDVLKNNFETVYKEYKDYDSFIASVSEEVSQGRKAFRDRVLSSNEDEDVLSEALFELSIKPLQSGEDLRVLRDRLINTYDAYKIVLDFPETVKEEMRLLKRPLQSYRIHNGKQEEIDKEKNDRYKKEVRKTHLEVISALKQK